MSISGSSGLATALTARTSETLVGASLLLFASISASAAEVDVAVAANFTAPMNVITADFE